MQAFGLKEVLSHMGHDVHILDYRPEYLSYDRYSWKNRPGLKGLFDKEGRKSWNLFFKTFIPKAIKARRFDRFTKSHLHIDNTALKETSATYDAIVCGSDQIWNPELTANMLDPVYFGILGKCKNAKVLSYAASAGDISTLKNHTNDFKQKLSHLHAVGVREQSLADFISRNALTDKAVVTVVDPTILAGAEYYRSIASGRLVKKPYILLFDLFNDPDVRRKAQQIAEEKNIKLIELATYHFDSPAPTIITTASPNDFCSLFLHADCVITTSFHGTAFSILFHKEFFSIDMQYRADRITNLLEQAGITERFIPINSTCTDKINWSDVDKRLTALRNKSMEFLSTALRK